MTGFPVLMYYLWACLWFYDGRLVYPHSLAEAKPLFLEIWGHVKEVRFKRIRFSLMLSNVLFTGCFIKLLRLEGVHRIHGSSTPPRPLHAMGIPTRGSPSPISRLQDTHV